MNYWWVNHKQTYRDERGGNYIWSPQRNRDGSSNQTYTNLTKVRPGDIVFSYANGVIGALGVAADQYFQSDRPVSFGEIGEQWDKNGWKVSVNWTRLGKPISPKDHLAQIGPLYRNVTHRSSGSQVTAIRVVIWHRFLRNLVSFLFH